ERRRSLGDWAWWGGRSRRGRRSGWLLGRPLRAGRCGLDAARAVLEPRPWPALTRVGAWWQRVHAVGPSAAGGPPVRVRRGAGRGTRGVAGPRRCPGTPAGLVSGHGADRPLGVRVVLLQPGLRGVRRPAAGTAVVGLRRGGAGHILPVGVPLVAGHSG